MAERYDKQYQSYLKHTHEKLLSRLQLTQKDEILDSSAGTGLLAQEILKKHTSFKRLVLNDPSSKMLERAKYRLRYNDDIEFYGRFCEQLPFDDNTFSQIICLNSFHYYTHQGDVLRHFRRMLKPGGNLWILDWNRTGSFKIASTLISWLSPENINSRSLDEMKILLQENDFNILEKETWGYRWWNFFFVRCIPC
nr:methyltransferase domain-containing protein [Rhodohalobacter sp. 614A]